jgi:hypothetical protein
MSSLDPGLRPGQAASNLPCLHCLPWWSGQGAAGTRGGLSKVRAAAGARTRFCSATIPIIHFALQIAPHPRPAVADPAQVAGS